MERNYENQVGLGRVHIPDPDDHKYLLPRSTPQMKLPTSKHWPSPGAPLDQGNTSECVLHAGDKYLTSYPVSNKSIRDGNKPTGLTTAYKIVQTKDEWPGEDYDGTSVRGLFKYLKELGYLTEYRWAFEADAAITHILTKGPVVLGTDWYMDMFTPDRWGYIWPTGEWAGGHSYLGLGVSLNRINPDKSKGAVRILNSWGGKWGENGRAWIALGAFDKLIRDQGEAGCATELKRVA